MYYLNHLFILLVLFFIITSCGTKNKELKEKYTLSNGTQTECYKVVVKSIPHEHRMGPWCPTHINDSKEKGGIWFEDGKVYDVNGHFISNIGEFYSDEKWKLYNNDGSIKITKIQK